MPTRIVAAETMEVGKKGGRKHWTQAEVDARQKAADELKRKKPCELKPPEWLGRDARAIWKQKLAEIAGLNSTEPLLDVLDGESFAVYCDSVIKYKAISNKSKLGIEDHKVMQAYARIISSFADKLGFTPAARARLIKKRAEKKDDPFGDEFDK